MRNNFRALIILAVAAVMAVSLSADMSRCVAAPQGWGDESDLLARVVMGEATGEPFTGMVAVAAVIINRTKDPAFPPTLSGVIYDPDAFESVTNGLIWSMEPTDEMYRAAELALNGYDPTYGCTFFWNPYKPVSPWIWSRPIVIQIGNHVFAY